MDAKAAGKGKVTCKVLTPQGMELDMDVVENHDGTFDIYYTAPEPGKYVITIRFGGQNIPNSPFHVVVSEAAAAVHCFLSLTISCYFFNSYFSSLSIDRPQMSQLLPGIPWILSSVLLIFLSPSHPSKEKSQV